MEACGGCGLQSKFPGDFSTILRFRGLEIRFGDEVRDLQFSDLPSTVSCFSFFGVRVSQNLPLNLKPPQTLGSMWVRLAIYVNGLKPRES